MSTVEEIERAIASLSPTELAELRSWFAAFAAEACDRHPEPAVPAGGREGRPILAELLAGITPENRPSEWATGPPAGSESL